jgi:hypothetical protein
MTGFAADAGVAFGPVIGDLGIIPAAGAVAPALGVAAPCFDSGTAMLSALARPCNCAAEQRESCLKVSSGFSIVIIAYTWM